MVGDPAPPARAARIAFFAAAALLAFLALDGGGYDVIPRQSVAFGIWVVIAIGFATGVLPRANLGRLVLVPAVAVAALAAWMVLSFGWTASDERTMAELARVLGYAGIAILALASLNRDTFRAAAAGLSVAALGIAGSRSRAGSPRAPSRPRPRWPRSSAPTASTSRSTTGTRSAPGGR